MRAAIWQPMSTAPRDGTIVDLHLTGGGRYSDAWWESEDSTWCGLEEEMFDAWAPLPEHRANVKIDWAEVAKISFLVLLSYGILAAIWRLLP